jgi:hypothetical protein
VYFRCAPLYMSQVVLNGPFTRGENFGDLHIPFPLHDPIEHFAFPCCKITCHKIQSKSEPKKQKS